MASNLAAWKRKQPLLLHFRSSKKFVIFTVSTAVFTDIFLYGVIVPVMPFAVQYRTGVDDTKIQETVSILLAVYAGALLVFSPLSGWVADHTQTRRMPLLVSLLFMTGATLLLMLGRSIGVLVAGRVLQGASAAAVWSIGLALLVDSIGSDEIGEAMGYVSLSMSLGMFLSPLLGGIVYQRAGYFAVYYMAFGAIGLDIILRFLIIEKAEVLKWIPQVQPVTHLHVEKSDRAGKTTPLSSPDDTASQTRNGYDSAHAVSAQITENVSIKRDSTPEAKRRTRSVNAITANLCVPRIILLLASRRLLTALWGCLVIAIIMTSFDTVLPLRVARIFGWDSTGAGLIFLAIILPSLLNPLIGKFADRYGSRLSTSLGLLLNVPFLTCLRFVYYDSITQKVTLCVLLAFLGFALSCSIIPLLAEITWAVDSKIKQNPGHFGNKGAYAQGFGLMNTAYAAGTLIGPLWSGFVNEHADWNTMAWSLALLAGLSAFPNFLFLGGWVGETGVFHKAKEPAAYDGPCADSHETV